MIVRCPWCNQHVGESGLRQEPGLLTDLELLERLDGHLEKAHATDAGLWRLLIGAVMGQMRRGGLQWVG